MSFKLLRSLPFRLSVVNLAAAGAAMVWVAAVGAAVVQIGGEVDASYMELRAGVEREVEVAGAVELAGGEVIPPFAALRTGVEGAGGELGEVVEEIAVVEALGETAAEPVVTFDGRRLRKVRTIRMRVTAYSPDERSCGKWADGITASGYSVWTNGMKLVAADTRLLPFHSLVSIPGYADGKPVPVLDRGGAIKGNRLDVLYPTHEIALEWGVQWLDVDVWEYVE